MPQGKNCPNCGAPYDPALNKCPYCGTIYFDMSCIDFADDKPIYLKIRTEYGGKPVVMTQLVYPHLNDIHIEQQQTYTRERGVSTLSVAHMPTVTINIAFESVPKTDGTAIVIEAVS